MISLNIQFENLANYFFEGDEVRAKLVLNIEDPADHISRLTVTLIGISKCTRENVKEVNEETIWHVVLPARNDVKKYHFNHPILLYKTDNEKTKPLGAGSHEFKFAYQLPEHLPSSLESNEAYVRYFILVTCDANSEAIKKTDYFTVVSKVDLNNYQTDSPAFMWLYQNIRPVFSLGDLFLCGCCQFGNIRAFLHIDKTGYVPGNCVKLYARIDNLHSRTIDWVKVAIVQTIKFNCSKLIKRKRVINELLRGSVMPYESQVWRTEEIPVPALPPTTSEGLICIMYKLYLQIKPSWQDKTMVTKKKLVIGSIPPIKKSEEKGQGDLNEITVSEIEANFEPCFFGPHDVEEEGLVSSFSPMYPVYEDSY